MFWIILLVIIMIVMFKYNCIHYCTDEWYLTIVQYISLICMASLFFCCWLWSGTTLKAIGIETEDAVIDEKILSPFEDESTFLVIEQRDTIIAYTIKYLCNEANGSYVNYEIHVSDYHFEDIMDDNFEPRLVVTEHRWKNSYIGWIALCPDSNTYSFYIPKDSIRIIIYDRE